MQLQPVDLLLLAGNNIIELINSLILESQSGLQVNEQIVISVFISAHESTHSRKR